MSIVLIVLFLVVAVVLAASFAFGRATHEVESARDTEYLELEGSWIRYAIAGGGPPVLLVHGWLSSSRIWERLAGRLAQRFTVYSLDLTGFGESDKPLSGYGVRNGSRLLYAFCAHFGLTRASVIGHDLGGAMAVKLAADHPDVVGRLVLVSAPADENQIDLPTTLWFATLPVIGPIFYTLGRAARPLRRMWMRPFVADSDDLTEEVIEDAGRSTPAAAAQSLSIARREISRGRLARQARVIKIPLLAVAGEEDQIVDPQSAGVWAGGVEKAEICLIDECGHLPMIERTAEFDAHVLAFLTGDARYLDYVQSSPTTGNEDPAEGHEVGKEGPELGYREEDGEAYDADFGGPAADTADLTPHRPEIDSDEPEREDPPNVVRKRSGGYPPRNRAPHAPEDYPNSAQEDGFAEDFTEERPPYRDHGGPTTSGEDIIPELPRDLFDWPEPPGDFGTRGRSRGISRRDSPQEEPDNEEHPDAPEGPARF